LKIAAANIGLQRTSACGLAAEAGSLGLMSMHTRRLSALVVALSLSTRLLAKEPKYVAIGELSKMSRTLVGQRISTHGCLTVNRHGDFVAPCGSDDWRALVLAYDPTSKVIYPTIHKLRALQVEGDFIGVLEEKPVEWPKPGKRMFIRIEQIANARKHEP
jgi:hypothetical protein